MAATAPVRTMPRLLKATYLADQEFLMDETRATKLFYFPKPVLFTLIFAGLAYFAEAGPHNLPGAGLSYIARANDFAGIGRYLTILYLLLTLIGILWILVQYARWISTVYAVTSRRVIVQKGILGRDFDEIPVGQVRGVDVHQTFGQRILGYGTVRVSSEAGHNLGNEDWRGIPKPFKFQKLIENATMPPPAPGR